MSIDFEKSNGLVPVVVQHWLTGKVLMLAYMNEEAFEKTITDKKLCFYSRSKNRLWVKGETSGNFLILKDYYIDCDRDTLLMKVNPAGPACHTGSPSCFLKDTSEKGTLYKLENRIEERKVSGDEASYTKSLFDTGLNKIAQKFGEEAVELIIEAKDSNDRLFIAESADMMFHFLVLLRAKGLSLSDIEMELEKRFNQSSNQG